MVSALILSYGRVRFEISLRYSHALDLHVLGSLAMQWVS